MPRHEYFLVDVFTSKRFGGNPLAVFPNAEGIAPADMQHIAGELNLSETTFVLPTDHPECDVEVRIFTPQIEMPMAGHPTVGTAFVLDRGDRIVFLEKVGPIAVGRVSGPNGQSMWRMAQPLPKFGPAVDATAAAATLGLTAADLLPGFPVEVISTGAPFVFVPLRDVEALGHIRVRPDLWEALPNRPEAFGFFCFALDETAASAVGSRRRDAASTETTMRDASSTVRVRSRMFAPFAGVAEDPATGGASGPLGCYFLRHGLAAPGSPLRVLSRQGVEMGRPSEVHIDIAGTAESITAVGVAGECVAVGGGYIQG